MHPAYSVILFTTASGAGYGLWFWLGLRLALGPIPATALPSSVALVLGGGLVTLGLLSSTFHLGHPERAWRALGQWRSSWLSREGVTAVITYVPAAFLLAALLWPALPGLSLWAVLLAVGSVATVWCTGMIYASLRTVPEWNHRLVPVIYLTLAAATGALLMALIDALFGLAGPWRLLALVGLVAGAGLKWFYWQRIDGAALPFDLTDALGVPGMTRARPLDPPHTQPNFVMREMGYAVARRHARRLRGITLLLLLTVPIIGLSLAALLPGLGAAILLLCVAASALGVWVERWLFFAEARHLSMLYYGSGSAEREATAP